MLPEEDLLQHIAAGNEPAFRQLYDLFHRRVYNTCLSYLQSESDAEEATQDVFVEAFRSAAQYRRESSVNTWLYRIAVNKCLDRLRYAKRQKRFAFVSSLFHRDTGALQYDVPAAGHPGIKLEQKQEASVLFGAIRRLPENQQTAFILKQVEGLPQKEIAAIMNISEKAVESLIQRAKTGLRKYLENFYETQRK
ncbi:RNA polymerase sigma factor [Chitinophagaceae bacterium MMS25-I14]